MITQQELKEILDYDPNTGIFTWKISPTDNVKSGSIAGTITKNKYWQIRIHGKNYLAHRLAWLYMTGNWPADQIDHINRIKKDNRWCNLREVSNKQNSFNKNSKGYNFCKRTLKFRAKIHIDGKSKHLGYFDTEQEAADAYQAAKLEYHKI